MLYSLDLPGGIEHHEANKGSACSRLRGSPGLKGTCSESGTKAMTYHASDRGRGSPLGYYSTVSWPVASQGPSHRDRRQRGPQTRIFSPQFRDLACQCRRPDGKRSKKKWPLNGEECGGRRGPAFGDLAQIEASSCESRSDRNLRRLSRRADCTHFRRRPTIGTSR